jgi:thiol-disulfide isomerase/thioredoxin
MSAPRAAVLASFVLLALAAPATAERGPGERAAELVRVVDGEGRKVTLRALAGRVVVMTFGASWCAPCKKELPAFERLAARYAAKGAKVAFLAINIDTDRAKGAAFVREAKLRHVRVGFDVGNTSVGAYDPEKMPTTFVMRGGIVRHVHGGYTAGDEVALARIIDRELARL